MCKRLDGRVAIVTGAGRGIGRAYCHGLVGEGAQVVIAEIDGASGERTAEELRRQGGTALAIQTDVSDEASVQAMAAQTLAIFGRIDVLVNNAGASRDRMRRVPLEEISLEEWDRLMAVNLRGMFLASRAVLSAMKRQGKGKIVNIGSSLFHSGAALRAHYVTSRAGVLGFTRTLAREAGPSGITVNALALGAILSEENPTEQELERMRSYIAVRALPRIQLPADAVGPLLFLVSDEAAFITGQTLTVDGGQTMH